MEAARTSTYTLVSATSQPVSSNPRMIISAGFNYSSGGSGALCTSGVKASDGGCTDPLEASGGWRAVLGQSRSGPSFIQATSGSVGAHRGRGTHVMAALLCVILTIMASSSDLGSCNILAEALLGPASQLVAACIEPTGARRSYSRHYHPLCSHCQWPLTVMRVETRRRAWSDKFAGQRNGVLLRVRIA